MQEHVTPLPSHLIVPVYTFDHHFWVGSLLFHCMWAVLMGRWKIGTSPLCPECNIPPTDDDEGNPYRWEFALLLEDSQGDTIPVTVAHEDAMNLLQLTPDK